MEATARLFPENAERALGDPALQASLARFRQGFPIKRRAALDRLFRSTALDVETFRSGAEMLDRLGHARPRCLVLDLALPGADGLDVFRLLRGRGEAIPVVFIAAGATVQAGVAAMKAWMCAARAAVSTSARVAPGRP